MPHPFDDGDWDGWFVWQAFVNRFEFSDATGGFMPAALEYEVDSKAMRKVGPNETVVTVAESQLGALEVGAHLRTLLKLA